MKKIILINKIDSHPDSRYSYSYLLKRNRYQLQHLLSLLEQGYGTWTLF